jgi:copper(I)-binding protein
MRALVLFLLLSGPAAAQDAVAVSDAFVKTAGGTAGAAYFTLENRGAAAERLTAVSCSCAARAEMHSSGMDAAGMMVMAPLDGIDLPPGESHALVPGGEHVMLFGMTLAPGATATLTLSFASGATATVEAPVRGPGG